MIDPDELVLGLCFAASLTWLEELKAAPLPLPYGVAKRWESFLISASAVESLYGERCPYAWGYAAVMEEMRAVYDAAPKIAFVPKKK